MARSAPFAAAKALRLKLLPEEKKAIEQRGTTNLEAYNLFLMARQYSVTGNYGNIRRCEAIIRLCRGATQIDPEYATAWALMAVAQAALRFHFSGPGDGGLAAAERALSLDGTLAEAHAAKARVLTSEGAYEQALAEIDIALGLDPESFEVNTAAARLYFTQGLHNDAIRFYEKAVGPDAERLLVGRHAETCYGAIGDAEASATPRSAHSRAPRRSPPRSPTTAWRWATSCIALADLGEPTRAKELAKRAMLLDPDNLTMLYNFGCGFVRLRDFDMALDVLSPVLEKDTAETVNWAKVDPDLDAIREHPRFKAMLAKADARLRGE